MSLEDIDDAYVLSPIQAGMLFDSLANPTTDIYVTYVAVDLAGEIDVETLRNAWTDVFQLHQSLRAEFHWQGLDEPLQVIRKKVSLHWCDKDWRGTEPENNREALLQLIRNERSMKFDLSRAPLSRFTLVRLSKDRWTLLWAVHHLLADGLSTPTILKHVIEYYTARSQSTTLDAGRIFQYSDYIAWLGAQDHESANSYWKSLLSDAEVTPLRLGRPSLADVTSIDPLQIPQVMHAFTIGETNEIKIFCQTHRITLSTLLHGLWALVIREYSGRSLSLFVSTVSGRHPEIDGMDEAVGLYLNAQPRLIDTASTRPLAEWLSGIQGAIHESANYDYSSLGDIQKYIAKESGEQWFDSIITVGGHPSELDIAQEDHSFIFNNIKYQSTLSHYPLAFLAFPGNCLEYSLVYDPAVFCAPDIEAMSIYIRGMLDMMLSSPDSSTEFICQRHSYERLDSMVRYPDSRIMEEHSRIHQWIESTGDRHPDKTALLFQRKSVTFSALEGRANQVARLVQSRNLECSSVVGVLLPRSPDQIAALLGILKAGLCYVPIDASWPATKVNEMLASAVMAGLVTTRELALTVEPGDVEILLIEEAHRCSTERLTSIPNNADNLAYIMFTSGSTGKSKAVKITHDNLVYSTSARIAYYQEREPVFLLLSSIAFDSSVAGIYWVLCGGGTLVLPEPDEEKDIDKVADLISENKVTHSLCLPSYYKLMLHHASAAKMESLKTVIVAGEACGTDVGILHFSLRPEARLFNEYGPTEACVWSSVHELTPVDTQSVPIGKAIGNSLLVVLNCHGNLCPPGVEGEIHIGGGGVSPGYLHDASATVDRFVRCPSLTAKYPVLYKTGDSGFQDARGMIVFTGREDRQLKIRGYRIEPAEVEAALMAHPDIELVIVVAVDQISMTEEKSGRREMVTDVEQLIENLQRNVQPGVLEDALTRVESMNFGQLTTASRLLRS